MATAVKRAPCSIVRTLTGVAVMSTGSYVPERVVTNDQLAVELGCDPEWIVQRTGIRERRFVAEGEASSDMAIEAARQCLQRADVAAAEVDLLIVATWTPDVHGPATACLVQDRLGIEAPAFDISSACSGFLYALVSAAQFIATGCARRALVIGVDTMSRVINPADQRGYPLFGDGAGAVLLGPGNANQGLLSYTLGSDGAGAELLIKRMGGSRMPLDGRQTGQGLEFLAMQGQPVFRWAVQLFCGVIPGLLDHVGLSVDQVDLYIMHQANLRILSAAAEKLDIDMSRVFVNLDRYGNTAAASVPLALDEACRQGDVQPGRRIVLGGFGAGLSWGAAVVGW